MWKLTKRKTRVDRLRKEELKAQKAQQKTEQKEVKKVARAKTKQTIGEQMLNTLCTTSKQLVWLFSINGILWIWCSYILAFMGRDQIAESLSSNVCTIVLGQIGMYLISKTVENIFKYNNFGGAPTSNTVQHNLVAHHTEETTTTTTTTKSSAAAVTEMKEEISYEPAIPSIPTVPAAGAVSADIITAITGTDSSSESVGTGESDDSAESVDPSSLS